MLCQKLSQFLSQGRRQMLQIEINPCSNAIALSLSFVLMGFALLYCPQCQQGGWTGSRKLKKKKKSYRVGVKWPSNGSGHVRVNVSGLYFCGIYGVDRWSSLRLRVRLTLLNPEGKLRSIATFQNLF